MRKQNPEAELPRWTLHDLRRMARSLMSRAGVPSDHAERCLGLVLPGVRGTYDRHEYLHEKRHAFEALAVLIDRIVNSDVTLLRCPKAELRPCLCRYDRGA